MRLLLDAHVSGRRIGAALSERRHDVLALDERRDLDGCPDEDLIKRAAAERRTLVTFDVADFPRICREWLEEGKHHDGCTTIVGIRHNEFGVIIHALETAFKTRPRPEDWRDRMAFVGRPE